MAGVYIKGMNKPKECRDCPFNIGMCAAKVAVFEKEPLHDSGEGWCPLVEISDHGDLIDRSQLEEDGEWDDRTDGYVGYSRAQVQGAEAVIPADKEEV